MPALISAEVLGDGLAGTDGTRVEVVPPLPVGIGVAEESGSGNAVPGTETGGYDVAVTPPSPWG